MLDETPKTLEILDFLGGIIGNELARLVAKQFELLEAQNKDLKAKVEELTMKNNNAEDELETVKKKQAEQEQWLTMLLCVISTLTSSTTGAQQKVDPKNDSVKPIWY
nr:MAG TPA: alanyl-tRNA synthetase [Caudoviricetes sp.]